MDKCRNGMCKRVATFSAVVLVDEGQRRRRLVWEGCFCKKHLAAVLPFKMQSLKFDESIRVRRIWIR